jgi:hypothetical protein
MTYLKTIVAFGLGFLVSFLATQGAPMVGFTTQNISRLAGDVYQGASEVLVFRSGVLVGGVNTSSSIATDGTLNVGGGVATIDQFSLDTFTYNPSSVAANASATASFAWDTTPLPAVGAPCARPGFSQASTTNPELWGFAITANNGVTASGTLTWHNVGAAIDYATGTLKVFCAQ